MADKQISDLTAATLVQAADLFVLEQSGTAKKLTGQILENWLLSFGAGLGGIQSIAKTGTAGLVDTYTITYSDASTSTFTVTNGAKGDTGAAWYMHIKYASDLPTSDADMSSVPDNYIGIYSGTSSTAPTHYTGYTWFQWKGDTGATGAAATITAQAVEYMASSSGTVVPEGSWTTTIPTVPAGSFLWTRVKVTYNTGDVVTSYSVSRNGIDGSGAVSSVNNLSPDAQGNIALTATDIPTSDSTSVQQHITDAETAISDLQTYEVHHITGLITSLPKSFTYSFISSAHRVANIELGTPTALASNLSWATSLGNMTFTGTLVSSGSTTIDFDIVKVVTP